MWNFCDEMPWLSWLLSASAAEFARQFATPIESIALAAQTIRAVKLPESTRTVAARACVLVQRNNQEVFHARSLYARHPRLQHPVLAVRRDERIVGHCVGDGAAEQRQQSAP